MTATVPPTPSRRPVPDPAGRVELPPGATLTDGRLVTDDLLPVPPARRRTTCVVPTLWVGTAHDIPLVAARPGLVAPGREGKRAVSTIAPADVVVPAPMPLTGHAGPEYGIPFPVLARASFGLRGAGPPVEHVALRAGRRRA
ncbi:hypothetical protein ADK41_05860 [Streptomyces caelestis]|uniref:Uncharacterized protein n=1 Tax=Streptomyces caelestis TaxID=36816 RepID=A0A0N0S6E2_9ACTN|nr:hypothetical protein ADK41_05860 [Streptomyces caelestis]KOV25121.1 hypothetical protein ADK58_17145 [Streptomyces sp. XY152]